MKKKAKKQNHKLTRSNEKSTVILVITALLTITITIVSLKLNMDKKEVDKVLENHYSGHVTQNLKKLADFDSSTSTEAAVINRAEPDMTYYTDPSKGIQLDLNSPKQEILENYSDYLGYWIGFLDISSICIPIPIMASLAILQIIPKFDPVFPYSKGYLISTGMSNALLSLYASSWKRYQYSPPDRPDKNLILHYSIQKDILSCSLSQDPSIFSLEGFVTHKIKYRKGLKTFIGLNNLRNIKRLIQTIL